VPNALITGASQGFGRALALELAGQGWTVIATGRDEQRLRETRAAGRGLIVTVRGDVRERAHQVTLIDTARGLGGLDLLVHNASELGPSPLQEVAVLDTSGLREVYEVNVIAPVELTQLAVPLLGASGAPAIVALSSDAAVEAYPGWSGYGGSKAALDHTMAVLAAENRPTAVYAFDPGDMRTQMHQRAFPGEDISDRPEPETAVPALLALLRRRLESGRYRAADVLTEVAR
jgi:NAD(P)-dependent dehydrogenase (short-subunit alcohol dehydrogenase family)